jgi:hypothetical protein
MPTLALSESDLLYLLTLLRSSDLPMSTEQLVKGLRARGK